MAEQLEEDRHRPEVVRVVHPELELEREAGDLGMDVGAAGEPLGMDLHHLAVVALGIGREHRRPGERPTDRGLEKQIAQKLAYLDELDRQSPRQRYKNS